MSGLRSKRKGWRFENDTAKRWRRAGLKCQRMPLSGALGGDFHGDLRAVVNGKELTIQLKCLADGWKGVYDSIRNHDCLIIKSDRQEPLVILPESLFLSLVCGDSGDEGKVCEVCGQPYTGKHWCLCLNNNPELMERIAAFKARRST